MGDPVRNRQVTDNKKTQTQRFLPFGLEFFRPRVAGCYKIYFFFPRNQEAMTATPAIRTQTRNV